MSGSIRTNGRLIMAALNDGRRVRKSATGWVCGALTAPDDDVAELKRQDLVREEGARLVLTAAGRGWTARTARPDMPNRLLVERPLAGDAAAPATAGPTRPARTVTVNLAESPLGWLKARGLVEPRQFEAGERLRADWETAGLAPRVTMRWGEAAPSATRRGPGSAIDPTMAQISAKRRMQAAMDAAGPGLKDVLWRVACAGEGLEASERALGWPKRAGKLVLLMALDRVADHYGIR